MKYTILGAGGSVGNALAYELLKNNEKVNLVSRSGFSIPGATSVKANILTFKETYESITGSDVVYLCVGLKYDYKVWAEQWDVIMQNAIDASKKANAKLIFLDNVYMYGNVKGAMTEDTPFNPCSKKGELRARIAHYLLHEIKKENITATIARSADFYGPYSSKTSMLYILALSKMLQGKKAQWIGNPNLKHSFTYTLDIAKALVLLANDSSSFNQTWHLPTYNPALTGKQILEIAANELSTSSDFFLLQRWMVQMAGLFDKTIRETIEMDYQIYNEYYFDSTKFNTRYNFSPTDYNKGIKETIAFFKNNPV